MKHKNNKILLTINLAVFKSSFIKPFKLNIVKKRVTPRKSYIF